MGIAYNVAIVRDNLVLCLDAANPKNYNLTEVEVLVVAGGGGGGVCYGGGGGGGGVIHNRNFAVTPGSALTVTVGNGGTNQVNTSGNGGNGGNSVFGSLTATGGGYGGGNCGNVGGNGGSGGGGSGTGGSSTSGGTGTSQQGTSGGTSPIDGGGGGGGAGSSGSIRQGGNGLGFNISGTFTYYGGGGSGGGFSSLSGGIGGGGLGGIALASGVANATANTGGGGGGSIISGGTGASGVGGSGIVIVRYQGPQKAIGGTITSNNGYTIHTFTTSSTFTPLVATNNSAILGLSDFSGGGNFGTSVNGPTYSSANGGSLVFDGTNDYTENSSPNLGITGDISATLSCWFYDENTSTSTAQALFVYGNGPTSGDSIAIILQNLSFSAAYNGGNNAYIANNVYTLNNWNNAVITKTPGPINTTTKLYLNGVEQTITSSSTITPNVSSRIIRVGRWSNEGFPIYFKGRVSNCSIYNRALTAAEVQQNYNALAPRFAVSSIVTDGLVLNLDAGNSASYPGSGTTWTDLSGNGNNFNVNASAYSTTGGIPHMNFEGSFGAAKRVVSGSLSNVPNFPNATIMCFSTLLNSTGNWRTLIRGASYDHQVMIQAGANNLGMYDNNGAGFISAGFDVTTLPSPYTQFNCLTWKLSQSSPYYQFQYNNDPTIYSITNANATFNNGFSVIGAYHNGSTGTGSGNSSQYWGKIAVFLYYNRALTAAEIQQNYNALRGRFGI
jgi:hypothetical protein